MSKKSNGKHVVLMTWKDHKHPRAGGAEEVILQYAKGLLDVGYRVTRFGSGFQGAPQEEIIDGITIVRRYSLYTIYFFARIWWRKYIKQNTVDCIIDEAGGVPLLTPLYTGAVPKLFFIHHIGDEEWDRDLPFPLSKIGKRLYRRAISLYRGYQTVTVSNSTRDELIADFSFHKEHVTVLENTSQVVVPDGISLDAKEKQVMFLGRLAPIKRVDHAIQAFSGLYAKDQTWKMVVVGDQQHQDYRDIIMQTVQELGLDDVVTFIPFSEEARAQQLARSSVLLVPSKKEGYGIVVLEANTFHMPVIGYNVPGLRDSIQDGVNGCLVEDGDWKAMAETLIKRSDEWQPGVGYASMLQENKEQPTAEKNLKRIVSLIESI